MKKRQRGRRVPEQQIAGTSKRIGVPESARGAVIGAFQALERYARDGHAVYGRGFVMVGHYADDPTLEPLILYVYPGSPHWRGFSREQDLQEAIQQYDPVTQYVIFEATADLNRGIFADIQISIWDFLSVSTPSTA